MIVHPKIAEILKFDLSTWKNRVFTCPFCNSQMNKNVELVCYCFHNTWCHPSTKNHHTYYNSIEFIIYLDPKSPSEHDNVKSQKAFQTGDLIVTNLFQRQKRAKIYNAYDPDSSRIIVDGAIESLYINLPAPIEFDYASMDEIIKKVEMLLVWS